MTGTNDPAKQRPENDDALPEGELPAESPEEVAEDIQASLAAAQAQIAALQDQLLRAHAEMDNVRRRA